jgi:3-methyladenine DNA glycosylase/8-oxoguanine DNA glycosylase
MEFNYKDIICLGIKGFSIQKTFYNPGHFKTNIDKYDIDNDIFHTTGRYNNKLIGLKFYNVNDVLFIDLFSQNKLDDLEIENIKLSIKIIDVNSAFSEKFSNDVYVKNVIEKNKGKYRVSGFTPYLLYQNLMISTFLQNATVQRTISMCSNMLASYGTKVTFENVELFCFWTPSELKAIEEELRELKLGYRAKNILRITDYFVKNKISDKQLHELSTENLEKELLKIYGVGRQTVFYLLDGYFGRTEYLKHIPPWERKILSKYLFDKELCDEKYLIKWFRERYSNWCGYALNEIFIDIFYQHKESPFDWLSKIQREK